MAWTQGVKSKMKKMGLEEYISLDKSDWGSIASMRLELFIH